MEVKANVSLYFLTWSDELGHEHVLITVHPDSLSFKLLANRVNASSDTHIDSSKINPITSFHPHVITRVNKIMHIRPDKTLIETQARIDLLLCVINCVAVFLGKDLVRLLLLCGRHLMFCDYDSYKDEIVRLSLC